jgi:16S rRNA (guanine527-N7)-methyltransferase
MDSARIAELLEPYLGPGNDQPLTTSDIGHISTYIDTLQRWNARINLTAMRNQEDIVTRHFGESLFAARSLFPLRSSTPSAAGSGNAAPYRREAASQERGREPAALEGGRPGAAMSGALGPAVADIGSGAGFPGIPLKLWAPFIHLTLIESHHKKSTFLREVARALTLTDINIQTARAETLREKFDVATLRAVERFEFILPIAAGLVAPRGRLALLIGAAQVLKAQSALPTVAWSDPKPIPQSQSRVLLIGSQGLQP